MDDIEVLANLCDDLQKQLEEQEEMIEAAVEFKATKSAIADLTIQWASLKSRYRLAVRSHTLACEQEGLPTP